MTMKPSVWLERIDAAEERGRFSAEDDQLAGGWRTCAVGELMDGINIGTDSVLSLVHQIDLKLAPPSGGGYPVRYGGDVRLTSMVRLGEEFAGLVATGGKNFARAREIVREIRKRGHRFGLEVMR